MYAGDPTTMPVRVRREVVPGVEDLADAEVEDLGDGLARVVLGDEQVRGLEIAVDDAVRVRLLERLGHADQELERAARAR
jgi:hypothetical protein